MASTIEVANAYVALHAQMPGVAGNIKKALGGSDVKNSITGGGKSMGTALAGAVGGAVAAVTTKGIQAVMSAWNGAVGRVDTLNNFPKVMSNLGYSADDARASVQKMSDGLKGLPTTLDGMAGTVQQLAPLTGGLDQATDLSLALNNALLAGGKSTEYQSNAMEQYTQMLSVGKVDMAAWRSIVAAMPGQVDQLSQSLLGAEAGQNDLYEALKSGEVTFDDFNGAILDLNNKGLKGYASFSDQARSATDGIATSGQNLQTAITRGLADLIQKFQPQIVAGFQTASEVISTAFVAIGRGIDWVRSNSDWIGPLAVGIGAAALAWGTWTGAIKLWTTATEIAKGVQLAFNAAMKANPLGLIVTAIAAVVAGLTWFFTQTELGREIWQNVMKAIGAATTWLWETILQPAFTAIGDIAMWLWQNVLQPAGIGIAAALDGIGTAATWLWEHALQPAFTAIGDLFTWIWTSMIKPIIDAIVNSIRFWGAVISWLWTNAVQPAFDQIGKVFGWIWNTIVKPIIDFIVGYFRFWGDVVMWLWTNAVKPTFDQIGRIFNSIWVNVIKPVIGWISERLDFLGLAFRIAYRDYIKPAWDGVTDALEAGWKWVKQHVFKPFEKGIDLLAKGFEVGAKAIEKTWKAIKKAAAVPINFVLETIWNKGLRSFWNGIVDELGLDDMKLPAAKEIAFASGGVMPGYTPGRDVHDFYSPTAGRLALSGGEAIMRPEFTRAVGGKAGVDRLNAAARNGRAFADGGVWGWASDAWNATTGFAGDVLDNIKNAAKVAFEFVSDPVGAVKSHIIDGIVKPLLGDDNNMWLQTAGRLPWNIATGLGEKVKEFFAGGGQAAGGGTAGMGWKAMWNMVQAALPSATLNSSYRPGARTVGGGQSYHGLGRAIDVGPASMNTFDVVRGLFPNATELIYTPAGIRQLSHGSPFAGWSPAVKAQHYDHIHLAMNEGGVMPRLYDQGGWLPHGQIAVNRSGRPEAVLDPEESAALKRGLGGGDVHVHATLVPERGTPLSTQIMNAARSLRAQRGVVRSVMEGVA
ncbi:tape measure protein [Microbacterium halotolerans]|uniref:tape measure protein n=1 Tax=Microbacterium halotolerans TaxID=246613 RepID=UPI000E6AA50B|nr:tape measure protein [Microbacterium halotolerans]